MLNLLIAFRTKFESCAALAERLQSREVRIQELATQTESTFVDALEPRKVRKVDRLKRCAPPESILSNCSKGWKVVEVHTGEIHTKRESISANALELRQVRKAD